MLPRSKAKICWCTYSQTAKSFWTCYDLLSRSAVSFARLCVHAHYCLLQPDRLEDGFEFCGALQVGMSTLICNLCVCSHTLSSPYPLQAYLQHNKGLQRDRGVYRSHRIAWNTRGAVCCGNRLKSPQKHVAVDTWLCRRAARSCDRSCVSWKAYR